MKCAECKFYFEQRYVGGECRYDAPQLVDGRYGRWPSIQRDGWCGRFVLKVSTATQVVVGLPYIEE